LFSFCFDFYVVYIEIFFPSWVLVCPKHAMCMKKMSLNWLKKPRDFTKSQYRAMLNIQTNPDLNIYWDLLQTKESLLKIAFELNMCWGDPYAYIKSSNIITDHFHKAIYNLFFCYYSVIKTIITCFSVVYRNISVI
jgi:hypothetical protein